MDSVKNPRERELRAAALAGKSASETLPALCAAHSLQEHLQLGREGIEMMPGSSESGENQQTEGE